LQFIVLLRPRRLQIATLVGFAALACAVAVGAARGGGLARLDSTGPHDGHDGTALPHAGRGEARLARPGGDGRTGRSAPAPHASPVLPPAAVAAGPGPGWTGLALAPASGAPALQRFPASLGARGPPAATFLFEQS
jgi:hypothetical protein